MTIAQGIRKQTVIGKQTGLGVPKTGSGGQILRRKTSVFTATRDMFENDEIVSHQQSTGTTYGLKKAAGKIEGLLSASTYSMLMAAICRKDFAATAPYAAGIDVTASATAPQFVDASAGFLTAGLKIGDVGRWTGFAGTGATSNNGKNFLITALTAGNMTGVFLDGSPVVADTAGDTVTFTVVGKKTLTPLTNHTDDLFTVEEGYTDLAKFEQFNDCKVSQIAIALPATGNSTIAIDFVGLSRTRLAQQMTTPTAETTTEVMSSLNGAVYVAGTKVGNMTSASFTISGGVTPVSAVIGSNSSPDLDRGRVRVSGSFTGLFDSTTVQDLYDNETPTSLVAIVAANVADPLSDFTGYTFGRIKLTGDAPDDGEKGILRTYPFTAELNSTGGPALAWDQTILSIQDSAA